MKRLDLSHMNLTVGCIYDESHSKPIMSAYLPIVIPGADGIFQHDASD